VWGGAFEKKFFVVVLASNPCNQSYLYLSAMVEKIVTVDSAIKKGRVQLFLIPLLILLGMMVISVLVTSHVKNGSNWVPFCGVAGLIMTIALPFLYYFLMLTRWRIWAFSNIRNVHELKQRAILGQIYPKDNSFLWRLEIKTAEQKQQIANLEQKFEQPDVFIEDHQIPFETAYSYSQVENFFYLLFTLAFIIGAIALFTMNQKGAGILLLLGSFVLGRMGYKRYQAKEPLLIISNEGITTKNDGFHPWRDIQNEQIFFVSAGNASYYGISYETAGVTIKMSLKELTGLSSYKIDHVLRTYRGRYEASKLQGDGALNILS
jgi:hypothetical protein